MTNVHEKLLLQTAVVKQLRLIVDRTRESAQQDLDAGDMKRPRGLGSVSMSEPKLVAKVTDDDAFAEHCVATGNATAFIAVTGPLEEVLAVLDEHAPHLIGERHNVPDWLIKDELKKAEAGTDIPGVEVEWSEARLMVRTKDAAMDEALAIIAGTPLAIEEGDRG